jgi:hypothetical protein
MIDIPIKPGLDRTEKKTEDEIQRDQLGPRGIPGGEDSARMTPQREKETPKNIDPGHPA